MARASWEIMNRREPLSAQRLLDHGHTVGQDYQVGAYIRARGWELPLTYDQWDTLDKRFQFVEGERSYNPHLAKGEDPFYYPKAPIDCTKHEWGLFDMRCKLCGINQRLVRELNNATPLYYLLRGGQVFCELQSPWVERARRWINRRLNLWFFRFTMRLIGYELTNAEWTRYYDKEGKPYETFKVTRRLDNGDSDLFSCHPHNEAKQEEEATRV